MFSSGVVREEETRRSKKLEPASAMISTRQLSWAFAMIAFVDSYRRLTSMNDILERLMPKNHLSLGICALAIVFAMPAMAQTRSVRVGGLTCDTGPRVGLLIGSRQRMNCVFRSNTTGQQYRYRGRITRLGVDVGISRGGRLFWGVFAPTAHIGPGALRGTYVGAGGNASLGLGLGANVLVGGSHRTISLQPLSIEGQVGVNLALGVAGLRLY